MVNLQQIQRCKQNAKFKTIYATSILECVKQETDTTVTTTSLGFSSKETQQPPRTVRIVRDGPITLRIRDVPPAR